MSCSKWLTGVFYKLDCFYSFIQKGTKWTKEMYRGEKNRFLYTSPKFLSFLMRFINPLLACWPRSLGWEQQPALLRHFPCLKVHGAQLQHQLLIFYLYSLPSFDKYLQSSLWASNPRSLDWFLINVSKISGLKPEAFLSTLLYSFHRENYSLPPVFYLPTSSTI